MFYLELFKQLERHNVRYLLVGGLAMNLHGVPRMTMDIDIILLLDDKNLDSFIETAKAMKLTPAIPVALEDILDAGKRKQWIDEKNLIAFPLRSEDGGAPALDVVLSHNLDMDTALKNASKKKLGDTTVLVASIDDMIKLKQLAGRKQDLSDIEQLQRIKP
ncbi:MAG: hypothetical protein DSZ33_02695 [Gammaproteobacteria bacterium]|nr:MAG: hypothetical protein DSZ33_02695 [Gammaproteobacteria bacterium]